MAWARISDDFSDHMKVAELTVDLEGLAALGLWTLALSWVRADRRRRGFVPTGIAARLSAGNSKQLASRLVAVRLWAAVPGGWKFHDFEKVYEPAGLAEKRAAAGRAGGVASGKSRRNGPKQSASATKQGASFASFDDDPNWHENAHESGQNDDGPNEAKSDLLHGESGQVGLFASRSKPENRDLGTTSDLGKQANTKQSASKTKQNSVEASRTRAGSTTHYPDGSYEPSTPLGPPEGGEDEESGKRSKRNRGTRIPDDFTVTAEMVAWARERVPNVDGRHETEKFLNHWRSKPGAGATKINWVLTWKNWMLRASEQAPSNVVALRRDHPAGNGYRQSTTDQRVAQALALAAALEAQEDPR